MKPTFFLVILLSTTAHAATPDDYGAPETGKVRIVRDSFGVPHIIAKDNRSLFFGVGYAQAEDQVVNLSLNYLRSEGRISEIEGESQVTTDHLVRLFRIPERSREVYKNVDDETREQIDGFAAGVNHYIKQHRQEIPPQVEFVEPHQVLSFGMYLDTMFAIGHCRRDLDAAGVKLAGRVPKDQNGAEYGSNQFAVSPERSGSGACMLSMDPHLRHVSFFRWYEMHLVGPEVNVMGACFFGSPYVTMGRTEQTAWCMTVNGPDLGDVFTFKVNPENPGQYKGIDGWKDFETSTLKYKVAAAPGKSDETVEQEIPALWTDVGPVVAVKDGVAYVFSLPTSNDPDRAKQLYEMIRAKTMPEFRDAIKRMALVMFNILYADKHGDIFWISSGRVPKRDERIKSTKLRPGDEAWARWQGIHPQRDLPQLVNPKAGYVLNTNSGPLSITPEGAPSADDYPQYMIGHKPNSRQRRLNHLLGGDETITFEEMKTYATDTIVEIDDKQFGRLIELAKLDGEDLDLRTEVATVLENWDRRADLDSRGAVLFHYLAGDEALIGALAKQDDEAASRAIVTVAKQVQKTFGSLDVPWQEFSRIRRGDIEVGVAGSGGTRVHGIRIAGPALRPTYGNIEDDGKRYCSGGSSYGMIVDFSGETKAISCLPFGVSEHPDSPHFADMLPLYVKREFKPAWFLPQEVSANAESELVLTAE